MLLKHRVLTLIEAGEIDIVFRRWKRATVRAGGTLRTAVGVVAIDAVDALPASKIRAADAKRAGYESRAALIRELDSRDGTIYRIAVRHAGADPRIALRAKKVTKAEAADIDARLARLDKASRDGAWTTRYLQLIAERPEVRAIELAESIGLEKKPFKLRVRKLKELGLTESLERGYRLSVRGRSYLARL
jgi:hypothetical protein